MQNLFSILAFPHYMPNSRRQQRIGKQKQLQASCLEWTLADTRYSGRWRSRACEIGITITFNLVAYYRLLDYMLTAYSPTATPV